MRRSHYGIRAALCGLALALPLAGCGGGSSSSNLAAPLSAGGSSLMPAQAKRASSLSAVDPGGSPQTRPDRLRDLAYQPRVAGALAPMMVGSSNPVSGAPPVRHPNEAPCIVTLFSGDTFENYSGQPFTYTPSCPGPWAAVVLRAKFSVTAGIQFDRTGSIWLGANNLYFGTTAEPSPGFSPHWSIQKDVTNLSSLFTSSSSGQVILGNTVNSTYNGIISGSAQLDFYPATTANPAPVIPDQVLGLSAGPTGGTVALGTPGTTMSVTTTFPRNVEQAYLDLELQSQNADEFWYSCFPNDLAQELNNCGSTAFREGEVTIDGTPAGVAPIYPWIYTGGIDPNLWIPIVGVQTLDFTPYRVDLTPFAGLLDNGQPHTVAVSVFNADNYFSATGSLLLFLDHGSTQVTGAVTADTIAAAPISNVAENVAVDSSGAKGTIDTRASHPVFVSGYVDTSHGRVQTIVAQRIAFSNRQQILFTSSQSVQNIEQLSTVNSQVTTRSSKGLRVESTTFTWPLTLDFAYAVAQNGSGSQTTSVTQNDDMQRTVSPDDSTDTRLRTLIDNVATTDRITFQGSTLTGAQGSSTAQYEAAASYGYCYDRQLASKNYVLTESALVSCL